MSVEPDFAELVAATNYSFLRGASHPSDMVARAMELDLTGIGIADRNTVAGVVRAWQALRDAHEKAKAGLQQDKQARGESVILTEAEEATCRPTLRLVTGARLVFEDGTPDIVAYPATRRGWGRLTRLLTLGNMRAVKGDCILRFADLLDYLDDLLLIVLSETSATPQQPHPDPAPYLFEDGPLPLSHLTLVPPLPPYNVEETLRRLKQAAPGWVWLGLMPRHDGRDGRYLAEYNRVAAAVGVPALATNAPLYATPEQRPLHDILTCILEGVTIADAGKRLEANAEHYLRSRADMARTFSGFPEAMAETMRFLDRIAFRLDDLKYEYPHEPVPEGWDPQDWLEHLVIAAAHRRYGADLPRKVSALIAEEYKLIRERNYAYYFLTVHDLVAFARAQDPPILCQGRGSAANSIVCFLLGVTSVDPMEHDLLFSRFVSEDRNEPPDIDIDFEHERREEVMQYVYRRYGRHRAGIAATVIHYRPRSAVREVGKALGISEDVTSSLSSTVWGSHGYDLEDKRISEAGYSLSTPQMRRMKGLVDQILKFPRHLSQHVGGFVLTQDRLDETVPIHHGAMKDRSFIEWDKDDIDALGLMKVDVLALGMLTCIQKAFTLMRDHGLGDHDLGIDIKADDKAVYDMLCTGDSIGVFQVESRAQINMLPRLKPRNLYDLTVQVAIVRPGPIEGDMVHPYLRRRSGVEKVDYPSPAPPHPRDELFNLLNKTCGVPLFQEQAMKLAIVAAEFTPAEANQLRRAMATFRNLGTMHRFKDKLVGGMVRRGYRQEFAERCYKQIEGFGSYGFPESHALSFARLVYVSAWIKYHQPAVFAAALLNSQPMGFYAPAQIVGDARTHGVDVRPIDVNASDWDNSLERAPDRPHALRLGLRQIGGFREDWAEALVLARSEAAFTSIEDLARRAALSRRAMRLLADADGLRSIGLNQRDGLWAARRIPQGELPLFAAAKARELAAEPDARLPPMPKAEQVVADYQMTRLSLKGHPMEFLRALFAAEGVLSCTEAAGAKNGATIRVAGIVLVRQRPGKGNAIFITLEDEGGITNLLLWSRLFESQRRAVMASRLIVAEGVVQKSPEGVMHLMTSRVYDRTGELTRLQDHGAVRPPDLLRADIVANPAPERGHPRNVRMLPKSRDFH